jgi:uncharacterized phage infection (PIP) family protein YhgE
MNDLYGDDAMALSLFRKAADAIVAKSELGNAVKQLQEQLSRLEATVQITQGERDRANDSLRIVSEQANSFRRELQEQKDSWAVQQQQIEQLSNENAAFEDSLAKTMMERDSAIVERDRWMAEYEQADTFRKTAEDKLRTIQAALGNGVPEVTSGKTFPASDTASTPVAPTTEPWRSGDSEPHAYGVESTGNHQEPETSNNPERANASVGNNEPDTFRPADAEDWNS